MFERRFFARLGYFGIGTLVVLAVSHIGIAAITPVALAVPIFGAVQLLPRVFFGIVARHFRADAGSAALYGGLARRLAANAGIVLNLISASISAAGVGLLAMLPVGSQLGGPRYRASFSPA